MGVFTQQCASVKTPFPARYGAAKQTRKGRDVDFFLTIVLSPTFYAGLPAKELGEMMQAVSIRAKFKDGALTAIRFP